MKVKFAMTASYVYQQTVILTTTAMW